MPEVRRIAGVRATVTFAVDGATTLDEAMKSLGIMDENGVIADERVKIFSGCRYEFLIPHAEPVPELSGYADQHDEPKPAYWNLGNV